MWRTYGSTYTRKACCLDGFLCGQTYCIVLEISEDSVCIKVSGSYVWCRGCTGGLFGNHLCRWSHRSKTSSCSSKCIMILDRIRFSGWKSCQNSFRVVIIWRSSILSSTLVKHIQSSLVPPQIPLEPPSAHSGCCSYWDLVGLSVVPFSSILHRWFIEKLVMAVTEQVLSTTISRILTKEHSNYVLK